VIRRSPLRLSFAVAAAAVALSGCATFTNTDVVAQVGDAELTTSEFTQRAAQTIGAVDEPIDGDAARGVVANWIYLMFADEAGLLDAHDSGPDNTGVACFNVFTAPDAAVAETAIDRLRSGEDPAAVGSELDPTSTGGGSIGCAPIANFNPEITTQLGGISIDDPYRIVYGGADTFVVSLQPRSQINGIELLQAVQAVSPETVASALEATQTSDIYVNPRFGSFQPDTGGVEPLGGPVPPR